jgi:hypothetical protein
MYSIQHYVIKFASDLWQVGDLSPGTLVSSTNKTDRHDIAEIVLKVSLNAPNQPNQLLVNGIKPHLTLTTDNILSLSIIYLILE